jgi:hypothetical protein
LEIRYECSTPLEIAQRVSYWHWLGRNSNGGSEKGKGELSSGFEKDAMNFLLPHPNRFPNWQLKNKEAL